MNNDSGENGENGSVASKFDSSIKIVLENTNVCVMYEIKAEALTEEEVELVEVEVAALVSKIEAITTEVATF